AVSATAQVGVDPHTLDLARMGTHCTDLCLEQNAPVLDPRKGAPLRNQFGNATPVEIAAVADEWGDTDFFGEHGDTRGQHCFEFGRCNAAYTGIGGDARWR